MAADGAPHVLIWLAVGGAVRGSPDEPLTVPPSVALAFVQGAVSRTDVRSSA